MTALRRAVDPPRLVEHTGGEELAEQVDQAAAAEAHGGGVVDRAKRRFVGLGVDPDVLDGAGARPHAVLDAATLEGGAGRAGAGDQPVLVAQHDLAVGADVDEEREAVGGVEPGADHPGRDVAADVAAHRRHELHSRLGVHAEADLVSGELGRQRDGGDVGLLAQVARVEAEQQVRHRRVAGDRDLLDLGGLDAVARLELVDQVVDRLQGEELQAQQPTLALGVDDARDHVLAAGDLLVVGARAVDDAAGLEVDEVGHDRRGPRVDGEPHAALPEDARIDAQETRRQVRAVDPVAHLEGDVHLPVGHAQVAAQAAQQGQLGAHVPDAVLLGQGAPQAVEVARVVGERGRLDRDVDGAHGGVLAPVAAHRQGFGLGHGVAVGSHLLVRAGRQSDLDLAGDERLAGEGRAGRDLGRRQAAVVAAHEALAG